MVKARILLGHPVREFALFQIILSLISKIYQRNPKSPIKTFMAKILRKLRSTPVFLEQKRCHIVRRRLIKWFHLRLWLLENLLCLSEKCAHHFFSSPVCVQDNKFRIGISMNMTKIQRKGKINILPPFLSVWKSHQKVSLNIASEASYVYILSGRKLIKNAKNGQFGE